MARRRWIERLARMGFAAKGIVYLILGAGAMRYALADEGRLTDLHGALAGLLAEPYGRPLLAVLAIGLLFYAAWRSLEAFADANDRGSGRQALISRALSGISGLVYGVLGFDALRLALTRRLPDGADLPTLLANRDLGRLAFLAIAAAVMAYGTTQIAHALSARLSEQLSVARVRHSLGEWAVAVSRIGIGGRGLVLLLMGLLLARRAFRSVAEAAATDTGDSLHLLASLPTGRWVLAATAAGLAAYGVFQLVQARHRTIEPP